MLNRFANRDPNSNASSDELFRAQTNLAFLLGVIGRGAEAAALAEKLVGEPGASAGTVYDAASVFALASAAPDNPDAARHAARAVALLRQAISKGYDDIPHL